MQLSGATVWWDEWQLRILVLASLGIRWFLLLVAPTRQFTIPGWFRTCIGIAFSSSDAVAIYALATLFNRHGGNAISSSHALSNGSVLQVLWAPVLLIHLGGQEGMTAYRLEDNDLWTRQAVTVVSQVMIALYSLYKSWPSYGDMRLLASTILLFIIGILSYSQKPWALRRASINKLQAVASARLTQAVRGGEKVTSGWDFCFTELGKKKQTTLLTETDLVRMILYDMSLLAADSDMKREQRRRHQRKSLLGEDEGTVEVEGDFLGTLSHRADKKISSNRWLCRAFELIYTRANLMLTPAYLAYHLLLVSSLHITAIALFAASRKRDYSTTDVKITYVLLSFTAALDILAEFIRQLLFKLMSMAGVPGLGETVSQDSNLIRSALRRTQPTPIGFLLKLATRVGYTYTEGLFTCSPRRNLYRMLEGLNFSDLLEANAKGLDFTSYRTFAPGHRNWVLNENLRKACGQEVQDSLCGSFDRGIILWHIATDLCIRRMTTDNIIDDIDRKFLECTEAISDYMAHLLNLHSDMLMTGSRQHLFTQAMEEVELILKDIESQQQQPHSLKTLGRDILAKKIIDKAKAEVNAAINIEMVSEQGREIRVDEPPPPKYPLVHDACRLAEELMDKMGRRTRCQVMYRVWVGMLFYSASMCRGYLHAKSLGEGGEFLSYVWIILSLKGGKTLADKLQMPEPEPKPGPYDYGEDLSFLLPGGSPSDPFFLIDS